jgi:hypothetical protein
MISPSVASPWPTHPRCHEVVLDNVLKRILRVMNELCVISVSIRGRHDILLNSGYAIFRSTHLPGTRRTTTIIVVIDALQPSKQSRVLRHFR